MSAQSREPARQARAAMKGSDPCHPAAPGTRIAPRGTPRASRGRLVQGADGVHARATAPPDAGRANAAAQDVPAKAIGEPKACRALLRGQTARDKTFEVL